MAIRRGSERHKAPRVFFFCAGCAVNCRDRLAEGMDDGAGA